MAPKRLRNGDFKLSGGTVTKGLVRTMIKSSISSRLEHQHYQTTASGTAIVAGNMYTITQGLINGDGVNQRDGDVIRPEMLTLKVLAKATPGNIVTQAEVAYRVILFQDMLNVGAAPVLADVLAGGVISNYDIENWQQGRFKVLYDRTHAMSAAYASNTITVIDTKIRMKGNIYYNAAGNALGANGKGSVWLLTLVDTVTGVGVAESYAIDLQYTDA